MSPDDKTSTARPTREDIEAARAMLNTAVMSGRRETVADILASAELVTRYSRVLDYALDCLTAEQEAETVPADDEGAPQVEPSEDAGDGDGWGPWIDWAGGECPVPAGTEVEALDHAARRYRVPASALLWAHIKSGNCDDDIVRYRVRLPKPAEPAPESDAAFLARHGVGEWDEYGDTGQYSRDWRPTWFAITPNGFIFPQEAGSEPVTSTPRDTTTPEGRAALDARLVAHLRAEGLT